MILLGMPGWYQLGLLLIFVLLPIILALIALIDILRNEFTGSNKIIWVIIVIILPILGMILYFSIGIKQKVKR